MVRIFKTRNMMNGHFFMLLVMAVLMGTTSVYGQIGKATIDHAVKVLKGIDTDDSVEWAIATLEKAAIVDSSSYAMNCLGIAYMAGIGVNADSTKAVSWLENAGRNGYFDAYHNLGMIYKYSRCGVKQNFRKAYEYFSVGAANGSIECIYDEGFMLYKGLGCSQNYSKAVDKFLSASSLLHSPSLYMLGLCYRNGYGVEKDTVKAVAYLNRASMLGYRDADDELARPYAETYLHEFLVEDDIPVRMPQVSPMVNDTSLIKGSYHGFMVMYDWSGDYILGEKPLAMNLYKTGSYIAGFLVIGSDTVSVKACVTDSSKLIFQKGGLNLHERYAKENTVKYRLDDMVYDVWNDKICGKLNLYSLKQKEPERPMYFELYRDGIQNKEQNVLLSEISIFPNPFEYQFNATFELVEESEVLIRIFNIYGMMVYQQKLGKYGKGKHQVTLSPNIKSGRYVVNIKAGKQILRSTIIKEGGSR